jgi:hypothetical protein
MTADLAVYANHRHCACGASFRVTCDNPVWVADLLAIWRQVHADAPHRPVTARQAAAVRRQRRRDAEAEVGA